ncbi:glycoside hydrolase family 75 protein [Cercophora newfieldiana]|uniref:Endo-chitosanase n=1 Tax=Cercophora newfieldiana TaxID=92897 RepID=A0AA40D2F2_9PEZI|nr:glycoside hydrolase family 75 protein [Cercophora newfieldiana]
MRPSFFPTVFTLCVVGAKARDVPQNVRDLYNSIRDKGSCADRLATGFWATSSGTNTFSYCGDHLSSGKVVYIQGTGGSLADMDIDCDGVQGGPQDDGRCAYNRSPDLQDTTAFQNTVARYRAGVSDLNTYVHPYVVFGNTGSKEGWRTFDPMSSGVQPLSVMAVVCGDKLVYGVWGDTNGDDGNHPMVGETSLALATACYGDSMTGSNGHSRTDVLYLAFTGREAVPGASGANWNASNYDDFAKSIEQLGDRLVERMRSWGSRARAEWRLLVSGTILGIIWLSI